MKSNNKIVANILLIVISVILGVLIAWQMKNINSLEGSTLFGNTNQADLQEKIQQLNIVNAELAQRNAEYKESLQKFIELGDDENAQLKYYQEQLIRTKTYAGLTDVKGPGAIITLDSSDKDAKVSVSSLLVIVNSLKANGAYAISINGERVVALTEISETGSGENTKVVMNGTNITSPTGYEISIIGEVKKLQDYYRFSSQIWNHLQSQGVVVNMEYPQEVKIPALSENSPAYRQNLLEIIPDESTNNTEVENK